MNREEINRKIRPVLLLLTMSALSVLSVLVVNYLKDDSKSVSVNQGAQELNIVEDTSEALNSMDTTTVERVRESREGLVLNATDTSRDCREAKVKIESYSVCSSTGSEGVDYKKDSRRSGKMVSKNAIVKLVEVTVPLELFSGSNVKDSNRKLTSTTPIYKPAGEQFDEKIANIQLPPGTNIVDYTSPAQDTPFATPYSTAFGQKPDEKTEEGEIVIQEKLVNECEHCNNPSNVNPDKSNKIATFLKNTDQRYPRELDTIKSSEAIEDCGTESTFIPWSNSSRKACRYNVVQRFVTIVQDILDPEWNECTRPDMYDSEGNIIPRSEDCIYAEDIIVVMNSPFGSDKECPDGICTNSFMNTRNKTAMYPEESSRYSDKVYFTTECTAEIEGIVGSVTIRCAWDFSHLYKERKISEFDDLPGVERTPTKDEYTNFLKEEGSKRSSETPIQIF